MKINITKTLIIIILSAAIGLIYNSISHSGISLIKKDIELKWAADSTLLSIKTNAQKTYAMIKSDSLNRSNDGRNNSKGNEVHIKKNEPTKSEINEDSGFSEPLLINLDQAYKLYQMDMLFIDARDISDYKAGHIKKSLSFPYHDYDQYKSILNKISKTQTIITYCGGADCELSKGLANQLFFHGYHNIYVFFGGWGQWKDAGYPVE